MVVESVSSSSNPCRRRQIRVVVVKSMSSSSNPHRRCRRIRVMVVKSVSSSLSSNLHCCRQIHVVVVESASSGFRPPKIEKCWPTSLSEGRGSCGLGVLALAFVAGSRWLKIMCVIHPSLEGRGDVAASSGVGDLKRTNVVSIQREHTEGRGGGNDGMKGRERREKVQST